MGSSSGQSVARLCATWLVALWVVCTAQTARAQVDMNGPWKAETIFGLHSFTCDLDFTQAGNSLSISGTCGVIDAVSLSGTIDPNTGSFGASGTAGTECPSMAMTFGTASLDNRTFFVGFVCANGPNGGFQGALRGARCGNGVVDAISGEQCDTAIHACCSGEFFSCQFSPSGAFCTDGNQCTDDMCDGAGTCLHTDRTGPCDDGNECTDPDECVAGACTSVTLPDGSPCEDFNDCTSQSCQTGSCAITNLPDGTPCNDFYECLAGETCLSGACQLGDPVTCPACQSCAEPEGCVTDQFPSHTYYGSIEDSLQLKKTQTDSARWRWTSGDAIDVADFGDPLTATSYELCVFDFDPMTVDPVLLLSASLPAGSNWKQKANGFVFKNGAANLKVRLRGGAAGKAKITVKAKGAANPVQYLPPISVPLDVQLRTAGGVFPQRAYNSLYFNPVTSTEEYYKAKNPEP